jgi:hypothetical protein
MVGIEWDISWHRSIGRDTFLTPAHIAIYMCGILAGIVCGYLILATTFGNTALRDVSVRIWGFRGPLGAFVAAWGGFAMLTSAPFDDWWHAAYGLDVKILSPPHVLLAFGIVMVEGGAVVLAASEKNRALGASRKLLDMLFLYVAAMVLVAMMVVTSDYHWIPMRHTAICYMVVAMVTPFVLVSASAGSGRRWAATTVTGIYFGLMVLLVWILPLFPAQPKLGPVYYQVTHFVAPPFPLLLFIPALALDWFWSRTAAWSGFRRALVSACIFVAVLMAVEWPFATFLQSPLARNWFFAANEFDYGTRPNSIIFKHEFFPAEGARTFAIEIGVAFVAATLNFWRGTVFGNWLRRVRR